MKKAGDIVGILSKPLFEKKGFIDAKIIANWKIIAGNEICKLCSPVKVTFNPNQKRNGTLYVSIKSPAFSLEVQSSQPRIIDKINTYFGYTAISSIKILIKNKREKRTAQNDNTIHKPKLKKSSESEFNKSIEKTSKNEELKKALERLKKSMFT